MAALVLLLGHWLPWWLSLALTGSAVIGIGEAVYVRQGKLVGSKSFQER